MGKEDRTSTAGSAARASSLILRVISLWFVEKLGAREVERAFLRK